MIWLLAACATEPVLDVSVEEAGVDVRATAPLRRVALSCDGRPVAARDLPVPSRAAFLPVPWRPGASCTVVGTPGGSAPVTWSAARLAVRLDAPLGQGSRPVAGGDVVPVALVAGASADVGLWLTAREPWSGRVHWGPQQLPLTLHVPGERRLVRWPVGAGEQVRVVISDGEGREEPLSFDVIAAALPPDTVRLVDVAFPVDRAGRRDRSLPSDRVALPAAWWSAVLRRWGLGWRPLDDQAPWAHQAVAIHNDGPDPLTVAVTARVVDGAGEIAEAFRSRERTASSPDGAVRALIRVPAHETGVATLPVYVGAGVAEGVYDRRIEVTPLGAPGPVLAVGRPLVVTRGSSVASGGFLAALAASLLGLAVLAARGPGWLRERTTVDLTTIALFGSLTFVVAAAARLFGYGVATVLGPFAPLLTGLVDDAFRTCLLAVLVARIPRPGVVTLATLVGYLIRGLAFGSFHPADLLYFGSIVCFLEGGLWVSGLTRGGAWRDEPPLRQWLRLSAAFGVANALSAASGLVVTVVLYRLFLADWYVALLIALPGFLYVVVGCWLAVGFAAALRQVEP